MATSIESNQIDLTPDTRVKYLTYGTKIYSTPKLSGILSAIVDKVDKQLTTKDVIFTEDIVCAGDYDRVGNITKPLTGTATIAASGRTVDDVFKDIFTKELSGFISVQPSVSATLSSGVYAEYEAGVSFIPAIISRFTDGAYQFGPNPNTPLSGWKFTLTDDNNVINSQNYNQATSSKSAAYAFNQVTAKDNMQVKLRAYATNLNSSIYANTNLGHLNSDAGFDNVRITQGTTASEQLTITCYRSIFVGSTTTEEIEEVSNAFVHTLKKFKSSTATIRVQRNASSSQVPLVDGAKHIIVAIPPGRSLKEVLLVSASNTPITESYTYLGTKQITGENDLYPVSYKVYMYSPARIGDDEVHDIKFS